MPWMMSCLIWGGASVLIVVVAEDEGGGIPGLSSVLSLRTISASRCLPGSSLRDVEELAHIS